MIGHIWSRLRQRRWLPQTLFGRLFAVLLAGILVSHLLLSFLIFGVFDQFRSPPPPSVGPHATATFGPPESLNVPKLPGSPGGPLPRRPPWRHLGFWLGVLAQVGALTVGGVKDER